MEGEGGGGVVVVGRAEIDTRAPFRSVKEAVMVFGEKVLAGEVYAHKLNEMKAAAISKNELGPSRVSSVVAELEGTKQSLEKAREESLVMASNICALQEELQKTKKELQQLKAREAEKTAIEECEIKDIKLVEKTKQQIEPETPTGRDERPDVQKRRYVKFANPPSLTQGMTLETPPPERQFSTDKVATQTKKKKKPLIPGLGGIFSKKKGHQEVASPKGRGH
ncbi:hypothetical protein Taro_038877 [Colocasia esculenta]|uniref:WEB family protein n=1 Tax=Colocasia esculenta TaxID=4460 RepID=A0A843WE29_COLES|nr:hypothetical protein [Colocasia esculenta]